MFIINCLWLWNWRVWCNRLWRKRKWHLINMQLIWWMYDINHNKLLIMSTGVTRMNSIFSLFQIAYKKENLRKLQAWIVSQSSMTYLRSHCKHTTRSNVKPPGNWSLATCFIPMKWWSMTGKNISLLFNVMFLSLTQDEKLVE